MNALNGKIALVTGASRGIGEAIASAMVDAGAKVVLASRKQDALDAVAARLNDGRSETVALPLACHTGDPDAIKALVARAEAELGTIDVLVNNAATNPFFGPLMQISDAAWDKTFDVNVKGYFFMAREVASRLIAAKRPGAIINITSVLGLRAAPFQGCYGATKAAVISLTQTLAFELGGGHIRVNAIAPGLVDTKFAAALVRNQNLSRTFTDRTAEKRVAQPEEIAGLAVFLASDAAGFITGQTLPVDGGWTSS